MKKTLCIEARPFAVFSDAQMERVLHCPELDVVDCRGKTVDDPGFIENLQQAEIIVSGNDLHLTETLLSRLPALRLVAKLGVGLDMIDLQAATRHGVMVCNTPGANDVAVAEHTFALLSGLLRQIPRCDGGMRSGQWEQGGFLGREMNGRTFGIVGMGAIGRCVAGIAQGFGGRVIGFDPFWPEAFATEHGIERRELDGLLQEADFLCIHCPLTPQTENLIGERELALMKPSAVLVNMARGGIVNEQALFSALRSRHISGAAVDAFAEEPPSNLPFMELDNVLLSPHAGAFTEEALEKMSTIAIDQVMTYLHGEPPSHLRNPDVLSRPAS